jgi:predicted esterase
MPTGRTRVPGFLISDYVRRGVERPCGLVLLLHGYGESGERIYRKLEPSIAPELEVIAPNGPFPLPERLPEGGYRLGFGWYFYDATKDEYFIDPELAAVYLRNLVQDLGLAGLPLRVIGFSQGGYLAPFLAGTDLRLRHVIGIGCRFLDDELPRLQNVRLDAVHGGDDDRVPVDQSRRSHATLVARGVAGEFRELTGVGHRITPEVVAAVLALAQATPLERA